MSKPIKLQEGTYEELYRLRSRGETFDDIVRDLLGARTKVLELLDVLEGQLKFREWQREQIERLSQTHRDGPGEEVRGVYGARLERDDGVLQSKEL